MNSSAPLILLRGGGDLASGIALRLHRCGFRVVIVELPQPLTVRRLVSFAEAVYTQHMKVEGIKAQLVGSLDDVPGVITDGDIPILIDPAGDIRHAIAFDALVDARMRKKPSEIEVDEMGFIVGLGPGFQIGRDSHAIVETKRGHHLGRVFYEGAAAPDTGQPEPVGGFSQLRVLRAPSDGVLTKGSALGEIFEEGEPIAEVNGSTLEAPFRGALRGLIHDGLEVKKDMKIGDLDPRAEVEYCYFVSDKALAVGGGVLEALLSQPPIRRKLAV